MKLMPPLIEPELIPADDLNRYIQEDEKWENGILERAELAKASLSRLEAMGCVLDRCQMPQSDFRKSAFRHVRFQGCDFTGCRFEGAAFHRVEFLRCRLTGADFPECFFQDVQFSDCQMSYVNFSSGRFKKCLMESCRLDSAAFSDCGLNLEFCRCDLSQAVFHHAPLKGIDVRDCNISGVSCGLGDVNGVIVTAGQAAQLAALMGVVVREDPLESLP